MSMNLKLINLMSMNLKLINFMWMNFVNKQISYFFSLRCFLNLINLMLINLKLINFMSMSLGTNVLYHLETSQLICKCKSNANQLPGFYMMGNIGY